MRMGSGKSHGRDLRNRKGTIYKELYIRNHTKGDSCQEPGTCCYFDSRFFGRKNLKIKDNFIFVFCKHGKILVIN